MELIDVLQQIAEDSARGMGTDLQIGTVDAIAPLQITVDTMMAPLRAEVLYLTEAVVEKKIPVLTHLHTTKGFAHRHEITTLEHTHTAKGDTTSEGLSGTYQSEESLSQDAFDSDERLANIICYEHGKPLPVQNGFIILNRSLAVGDKVLLLRVQSGQKFVILSRVFEGGAS